MQEKRLMKIEEMAKQCASKLDMEIISVEFVKEFGVKILRIIASKEPIMTIDDSSELNQLISDELDKEDIIEEEYYLEVSSEGLEKELKNDKDLNKAISKYICINTYEKIEGKKELYGDLISFDDSFITINMNIKNVEKQITIDRTKINLVRLAIKF